MAKNQRNGQRKPRSIGSKKFVPDLGYYLIVTDTKETEKNYTEGLKNSIPQELQRRLVVRVAKAKTTDDLVKTAQSYLSYESQYSELWIIFDRDQVERFDDIIEEAKQAKINVGWSNPCIEIWFNAYFGKMPTHQTSVKCCDGFKNTYEKATNQTYQKSDKDIYNKLCKFGDESRAIKIAENKLKQYDKDRISKPSEMCPATTVHRLVSEIKNKL